jgi:prolyl-tRNA editing enzyme YbaK/EbsC (Cys-tRNA(Pro) deacylase)
MVTMTPEDVRLAFLMAGHTIEIQHFASPTATAEQAADAIGCALGQIVKSLAFFVDDMPLLALVSGDQTADDRRIAGIYGVGRKRVRMATAGECLAIFGYLPGAVPPFGHRRPVEEVLIDRSFKRYTLVYAAAGAPNAIFGIAPGHLLTITGGRLEAFTRPPA